MSAYPRQWRDTLEIIYRDMGQFLSDHSREDVSWVVRAMASVNDAQFVIEENAQNAAS